MEVIYHNIIIFFHSIVLYSLRIRTWPNGILIHIMCIDVAIQCVLFLSATHTLLLSYKIVTSTILHLLL